MSELKLQSGGDVLVKHVQSRMAFAAADDRQGMQTPISSCPASQTSSEMRRLALEMLSRSY